MKRYAALTLLVFVLAAVPCQAQFLKKLGEEFLNQGQQQGAMPGQQPTMIGNVNLPPGQYMMTNVQTGAAFYVVVQNGQMYLIGTAQQQMMNSGQGLLQQGQTQQQGGLGGMIKGGLGNFLKNELTPQGNSTGVPMGTPQGQ
jgi:hypothetical protein